MFLIFDIIKILFTCAVIFSALKNPHFEVGGVGGDRVIWPLGLCELHTVRSSKMKCTRAERRKEELVWPE